jgi:hypothetical protein
LAGAFLLFQIINEPFAQPLISSIAAELSSRALLATALKQKQSLTKQGLQQPVWVADHSE